MQNWESLDKTIIHCTKCSRLVEWREHVASEKRAAFRDHEYWGKPVPGFGDKHAQILILGLAPGAHGSNRTGRMFTGDSSGDFLYPALYKAGFANQPHSKYKDDGLELMNIYISAVCRCAPPKNKPNRQEVENCREYLLHEINLLQNIQGFVALGKIAFDAIINIFQQYWKIEFDKKPKFMHRLFLSFEQKSWILASYHPSRQNTQTGRLTKMMFERIWERVNKEIK